MPVELEEDLVNCSNWTNSIWH